MVKLVGTWCTREGSYELGLDHYYAYMQICLLPNENIPDCRQGSPTDMYTADFGGCIRPQAAVQPRIRGATPRFRADNGVAAVWVGREAPTFGGCECGWAGRFVSLSVAVSVAEQNT
jgi:hypothetical protein